MQNPLMTWKSFKPYLVFVLLTALALILLFSKLVIAGLGVFAAGLIILGIQQLINLNVKVSLFEKSVRDLDEKNNSLTARNEKLIEENSFLRERHFQITQVRSILELNIFEIDTRFTRSVCKNETLDGRNIKYFGSLNVMLTAKYGVDCKELRFRYDTSKDELSVANISPRFLSFGNRKLEWDFFEIYEYRSQNPLAEKRWMASDDLYEYANTIKEEYRTETEKSLEKGPEEFSWIHAPLKQNVESAIRILFGGVCSNIRIADEADDTFFTIDDFTFDSISRQKKINSNLNHTD